MPLALRTRPHHSAQPPPSSLSLGSMKYVHVPCLNEWRTASANASSLYECEQCRYKYNIARTEYAAWLEDERRPRPLHRSFPSSHRCPSPSLPPLSSPSLFSLSLSLRRPCARPKASQLSASLYDARASCVRRPLARPLRSAPPQCSFRSDAPALVCQACARGCRQPAPPLRGRRRPPPRPSPPRGAGQPRDSRETAERQPRGSREAAERRPRGSREAAERRPRGSRDAAETQPR